MWRCFLYSESWNKLGYYFTWYYTFDIRAILSTIYLRHWVTPKHKIHKALFLLHEYYVVLVNESRKIPHLSADKILNFLYETFLFPILYDRISNFVLKIGSKAKVPSINFPAMEWTCTTAFLLVSALFLCVGASRWSDFVVIQDRPYYVIMTLRV